MQHKLYPTLLLATTLAACGGGGGGSTNVTANDTSAAYSGKRDLVSLNTDNQQIFADVIELSVLDIGSGIGMAARPDTATDASLTPLGKRHNLVSRAMDEYMARRNYQARAFNNSVDCSNGGSLSISGDLNDQTGQGDLTLSANQCKEDEIVLAGSGTIKVNKVDFNLQKITDYALSSRLSLSYAGQTYSETGVMQVNSDPYAGRVNVVSNINRSGAGQQILDNNITLTADNSGITLGGQLCESNHGCANISTPQKISLDGSSGQLLLTGASNSKMRFRIEGGREWLDLDANGDGRYESTTLQED
jgi:hypothetical protein